MCQMEIHAHAQTTTMLQAVAHNLATTVADLVTLVTVLTARGEDVEFVEMVDRGRDAADGLQRVFMGLYGEAVKAHPHVDEHQAQAHVGAERDLTPA